MLTQDEKKRRLRALNPGAFDECGVLKDGQTFHVPRYLTDRAGRDHQTPSQTEDAVKIITEYRDLAKAGQRASYSSAHITDATQRAEAYSRQMQELTGRAYTEQEVAAAVKAGVQKLKDATADVERARAWMAKNQYNL